MSSKLGISVNSRRGMRLALGVLAVIAALALSACGGGRGAIYLTVEATGPDGTLKIPDEVDRLVVTVAKEDGSTELFSKEFPLDAAQSFPLSLGLEPRLSNDRSVFLSVRGFKA